MDIWCLWCYDSQPFVLMFGGENQLTHKSVLPDKSMDEPLGSAYPWIVHGPERDVALVI
jgi:hypothetical protein